MKLVKKTMLIAASMWSLNSFALEVGVGEYKQVISDANTTLSTEELSDCSALVVLKDYDAAKDVFNERYLFHFTGSNLEFGIQGTQDLGFRLVKEVTSGMSAGDRAIWVAGYNSDSLVGLNVALTQKDYLGSKPLVKLFSNKDVDRLVVSSTNVEVEPNGDLIFDDDGFRQVIWDSESNHEKEMNEMLDLNDDEICE